MLKTILRLCLILLSGIMLFIGGICLFVKASPQQAMPAFNLQPIRQIDSLYWSFQVEQLRNEYGRHKKLLPGYELPCLLALSYYPELKDAHVQFLFRKAQIPLSARPDFFTLFSARDNRQYLVVVSTKHSTLLEPILFENLSFNAQVGILGHELAHVAHYHRHNFWQLCKFGLLYALRPSARVAHERSTDEHAVHRGLGWQLFDYARYVRTDPRTADTYEASRELIDRFYLQPAEILEIMSRIPAYGLTPGGE